MMYTSRKDERDQAKKHYLRNVELGHIAALLVCIMVLYLFPERTGNGFQIETFYPEPSLNMIEVPRTVQKKHFKKTRPKLPVIPVASEEMEMLQEVELDQEDLDLSATSDLSGSGKRGLMARQIYEVLPLKPDLPIEGLITLSILIGANGKMKDYRVLQNSTGSALYLERVLQALKESRWQAARLNGNFIDSWIKKTYRVDSGRAQH